MKIVDFISEKENDNAKFSATVVWEDNDRPPQELYFEIEETFAEGLFCNPNAFLVACIMPAFRSGERRILIDAEICPELIKNLMVTMRLMRYWYNWYGSKYKLLKIDAKSNSDGSYTPVPERAAFCFSGGIDSLCTLRANRLNLPLEHPASFKDGIVIFGLQPEIDAIFKHVQSSLSAIAHEARITVVPVSTNIRYLCDNWRFWEEEFEGAVLSAVGHALRRRITSFSIGSSVDMYNLHKHGSHPLVDVNYSSSDLQIRHDDITLSRLDKTSLVADWDVAIKNLRVCNHPEPHNSLNCGKCEKCVRTMLELLALGAIERTRAFSHVKDVSARLIRSTVHLNTTNFNYYNELVSPLIARGHQDLAHAIEEKLSNFNKRLWKSQLKKTILEFDSIYFNAKFRKIHKLFSR
jgi:hypothetical protein